MNLLVLDTSTEYCSIAIKTGFAIYSETQHTPREHNNHVIRLIDVCLKKADLEIKDIDFLCYGIGPGSFVGIRLSSAIMHGFSAVTNKPIKTFSSLKAMAIQKYKEEGIENISVVIDARMNEVYVGRYRFKNDKTIIADEKLLKLADVDINSLESYVIGDQHLIQDKKIHPYLPDVKYISEYLYNELLDDSSEISTSESSMPVYMQGTKNWKKINNQ